MFYTLSANEALESQVKQLEATMATLSQENSSLVKENATLVEEKANRIAEVRQSVSYNDFGILYRRCEFFISLKYSNMPFGMINLVCKHIFIS